MCSTVRIFSAIALVAGAISIGGVAVARGESERSVVALAALQTDVLAVDDVSSGDPAGSTVRVDVLANDDPSLVADSVRPLRPSDQARVVDFAVPGEGSWLAVAAAPGAPTMIEFIPNVGFTGDPTPQQYSALDANGGEHRATVTITYAVPPTAPPEALAVDDLSAGNPVGSTVRIDVLANDDPSLLAPSVRLVRPSDQARVLDVTVPGEGAWFIVSLSPSGVSPGQALIDFVPDAGFTGDPTPMRYVARDPAENDHLATITITYGGEPTTTPPTTTGPTTAPSGAAPTGTGTTAQPTGDGLPVTGSQNAGALVAFALLVGGILLLVIGARRRAADS
jgi:hypothetical protein